MVCQPHRERRTITSSQEPTTTTADAFRTGWVGLIADHYFTEGLLRLGCTHRNGALHVCVRLRWRDQQYLWRFPLATGSTAAVQAMCRWADDERLPEFGFSHVTVITEHLADFFFVLDRQRQRLTRAAGKTTPPPRRLLDRLLGLLARVCFPSARERR